MSGSPFREMFVELSDAAFAALQALAEKEAKKTAEPNRLRPSLLEALNSDHVGLLLCERFGWDRVYCNRNARNRTIDFAAKYHCDHWHKFSIDEFRLDLCADPSLNILDQITDEQDRNPRSCYCTPRAP